MLHNVIPINTPATVKSDCRLELNKIVLALGKPVTSKNLGNTV